MNIEGVPDVAVKVVTARQGDVLAELQAARAAGDAQRVDELQSRYLSLDALWQWLRAA